MRDVAPNWGMKTMTDGWKDTGPEGSLDAMFAAARDDAPVPSGDFMARLTQQAIDEMPVAGAVVAQRRGIWAQLTEAVGGWRGMSGLMTACAVGLWIGVSAPTGAMADLGLETLWGTQTELGEIGVDPLSGFELALLEG